MKHFIYVLTIAVLFGCATDFYLDKEPMKEVVTLIRGDRSLMLKGSAVIENNQVRMQLLSEDYNGHAEITYDNGDFNIRNTNIPMDETMYSQFKSDLYAAFYAGDYPLHSDFKMFGEAKIENGMKSVRDTDGYELYKVSYDGRQISLYNIIGEYTIIIETETPLGR